MNKKYTLPLLIIASLLSGCKPNEEKAIEAIKKDIRTSLINPESARFSNIRALRLGEGSASYMVCGEVNGKNVLGAYTGATRFNGLILDIDHIVPIVYMDVPNSSLDEKLGFKEQNIACGPDGVSRYLQRKSMRNSIHKKVSELEQTALGKAVVAAASELTYMSREMGDDAEVKDVYARETDDYAFVSVGGEYRKTQYYKFRKNGKGELEPVRGLSYNQLPEAVYECYSGNRDETCITKLEIAELRKRENKIDDFVVPAR
ncbi:hypothetical protein NUU98_20165 [Cronobacter sakazakii]|uniref:hypothetical protein n=1 Tax=Cronobacter TaxID=413496 RepID=UPI0009B1E356|nr:MULTISPECIES: hypothetical protein [Cronobacter]ELY3796642.1 hypothetical protein [Cronobacter sakazakii]ELY3830261.1 hypothetical protein [Cronobacter sakazakii]ELY4144942.1 hypothetical protein [Cronobacter sakazakii]MDI7598830.1 hypothetical protein [Cronobacter sakazakii]MDK1036308.1 hypothetical protein [Cronobacter sakazakii]